MSAQGNPAVTIRGAVTADQLFAMGDGRRELIRGEVIEMAPAGAEHGRVALRMAYPIGDFVLRNNLGEVYAAETGFVLESDPDTVRAPDVAFVTAERVVDTERFFPGAPDLAVEVLSPNDSYSDVNAKVEMWLAHGTQQVWVADPQRRTVQIFRKDEPVETLAETGTLDGGEVLPGFRLAVVDCFPQAE